MNRFQCFLGSTVLLLSLFAGVALASHVPTPICANLVLDPAGLGGSTETFDACLLAGAGTPTVGVVLMHGRTSSPDGPVVNELRTSLQTAGYTTLSIENPAADPVTDDRRFSPGYTTDVAGANYAFPEAYARVKAAINHLQGLGVTQVVVMGFSMGSRFSAATVARISSPSIPIIGLVGVGMYNSGGGNGIDPLDPDFTLDEVSVPVLDIYGDADTNAVTDSTGRASAYNLGSGTSYTQVELDCAGGLTTNECHKLMGLKGSDTDPLEMTVNGWMACKAPLITADCSNMPAGTSVGGLGGGSSGGGGSMGMLLLVILTLFTLASLQRRISYN